MKIYFYLKPDKINFFNLSLFDFEVIMDFAAQFHTRFIKNSNKSWFYLPFFLKSLQLQHFQIKSKIAVLAQQEIPFAG